MSEQNIIERIENLENKQLKIITGQEFKTR
jgi:hypothetical protein